MCFSIEVVDKRRMCPNCRAFISSDDKVCPYCEAKVGPRAIERRSPSAVGGLIPGAQFTTGIILLINIGLYIATLALTMRATGEGFVMSPHGRVLDVFGSKISSEILRGEWWRLITAGFLHGGILHIFMNSWALFQLGGQVEELYGSARFIVLYFVSTVAGFGASTLFSSVPSVGASAGIFGLIGVMIAFGMQHRSAAGAAVRAHYTQWAIYGLVMGLMPGFRIDNAAHVGGLAAGFVAAYVSGTPKLVESWRDTAWKMAAGVCLALTAYAFFRMFMLLTAVLGPGSTS